MMTSAFVERRRLRRRVLLALSSALVSGLATPAIAQLAPPAPVRQSVDANGVDLFLGTVNVNAPALSMGGDDPQGVSYYQLNRGSGWGDNMIATINASGSVYTVTFGGRSDGFIKVGTAYNATEGNGATLSLSGSTFTYIASDGTVAHFNQAMADSSPYYASAGRVTDITRPNGQTLTFSYHSHLHYCAGVRMGNCIYADAYRIESITSNYGYSLSFQYLIDDSAIVWTSVVPGPVRAQWGTVVGATLTNKAPTAAAAVSETFATITSGGNTYFQVTDPLSRVTKFRMSGAQVVGIVKPGSTSEDVTFTYTSGRVTGVTTPAGTVTYAASDASGVRTVSVTDPLSHANTYTFDIASQRMTSMTDALSHTISWQYDSSGRVIRVTKPEGNYVKYSYDTRGNLTETRAVAKSGSGLSDIVSTADYPSSCTNTATCNQPTTTTDPLGNVTDYAYDSTTGLVMSVKAPAPTTGAIRPETRYSYTALQAYYSNGTSIVASGQPVTLLTGISTCQTTASCAGTSDEIATTIDYGPQTTGVGNNLQPVSVTKGAGNGSLTATVSLTYDAVGNVTSVDGPLAGTSDTMTYRYDADRERVGVISPDPDGAGSLKRRAIRTTYNDHGIATLAEVGTVNGTSDTDWAGFTSLQQQAVALDSADRPVVTTLTAGGSTYQVSQYSYDAAGRLECTALRMNSVTWISLPSSACSLGTTGSYGPDRISKTIYDAAGQVTKVQTAYGTSAQADEETGVYNNNGTVASVTDAEGNETSYAYDGFDRLLQTFYPVTTAGAGASSSTDYEQLYYDAGGEVTARRLRDGNTIAYAYDHLGRLTYKDLPGSEPDVAYYYDNLGRLTTAVQAGGNYAGFGYDALGRATAQSSPLGVVGMGYDLAGRRTLTVWPDNFYVNYDYDTVGEVTTIRENGATSGIGILATYTYDDLGRRTSLTRGNGTSSSWGYDNVSRLSSLGLNLDGSGTTNDLTLGFSYAPSGQIASTTRSNNGFAWGGAANRNDASSVNGLNQVTTVGAGSLGYDTKGNLNSTGSGSYTYSSENLLLTGPSSASLGYNPLLQLYQESGASVAPTRFQYDGQSLIGEYDASGVMQRRYVMGPGTDEALVEYDKSGSSYTRVWLHADERGSIVAQSNDSGTAIAINSYDEYGVPASSNVGRFQYTGQTWLPSLGVYNYKARLYSGWLGRFMQTDPIGYNDGVNWYVYAGVDPINYFDSSGRDRYCIDPEAQTGCYDFIEVHGNPYAPPSQSPVFTHPSPDLSGNFTGAGSGLGESEPVIPDVVVVARQRRYEVVIPVPPPTARKPNALVIPVPPPPPRRHIVATLCEPSDGGSPNCAYLTAEEACQTGKDIEGTVSKGDSGAMVAGGVFSVLGQEAITALMAIYRGVSKLQTDHLKSFCK